MHQLARSYIKTILLALAAVEFCSITASGSDEVDLPLQQLRQDTLTKARVTESGNVQGLSSRFKAIVASEDFGPADGAALRIGMCADIAERLIPTLKDTPPSQSAETLSAIKQFLTKVSASIDEGWQFTKGAANVAPPPGVPNAAAGMNPNAISDPQLRKEYIAKIESERAKQATNNQQMTLRRAREKVLSATVGLISSDAKAAWTRATVLEQFGTDSKTKPVLEEKLQKAGRAE